jgi:hypothetical protein
VVLSIATTSVIALCAQLNRTPLAAECKPQDAKRNIEFLRASLSLGRETFPSLIKNLSQITVSGHP